MEDEHRQRVRTFPGRPQGADEPVEFTGLEVLADHGGQLLDGLGGRDVLDGDGAFSPLGEPGRDLGRGVAVDFRQLVEDSARRLTGDDRPGGEGDPFGGFPGRNVGAQGVDDGLLAQRLTRSGGRGLGSRSGGGSGFRVRSGRIGRRRRNARSGRIGGRRRHIRVEFGVLGGELGRQFRRHLARGDRGLLGGDLLRRQRLLVLVEFLDRLAILDRVLDEFLDGIEVGIPDRLQLNRRQIEVVLDPVLDPHRHQRVQSEFDQRDLPRQILGFVAHRTADDRRQPIVHRLRTR